MVPEGWQSLRLGELFTSRRERGTAGLPTMSVTLDRGLVLRETLDRKTDTNLAPEQHLLLKKGDIAYNMMRMWQGASGLAPCDAVVSPAYVVLKPTQKVDPLFASYFFKAARTIYLFWAYSYGLTSDRLRLYFDDFALIPVVVPPIVEQRKLGLLLKAWDSAIEVAQTLIANTERYHRALLQRLFAPQRLPRNAAEFALADLGRTYGGLAGKSGADFGHGAPYVPYKNVFANSRFDPTNVDFVTIHPYEKQNRVAFGDVLVTTSSETPDEVGMTSVVLDDVGELYLNSFCFGFRLKDFAVVLPQFARYLFRSPQFRRRIFPLAQGSTRYNLAKSEFLKLRVQVPPLEEQERSAIALATAEKELQALGSYLAALLTERSALLQQLLSGKRRIPLNSVEQKAANA